MEIESGPRIIRSDRLARGILITFEDGKSAFYPDSLLYTVLDQAELLDPDKVEEEQGEPHID